MPQRSRPMARATLPQAECSGEYLPSHRKCVRYRCLREHEQLGKVRVPSPGRTMIHAIIQGHESAAYGTLGRMMVTEHGMAYRPRGPWSRSARSTRGSNDPPRRSGKPTTGERSTGACGGDDERSARCLTPNVSNHHPPVWEVGPWRAGCAETRQPCSGRGRRKRAEQSVPRWRPTLQHPA